VLFDADGLEEVDGLVVRLSEIERGREGKGREEKYVYYERT